MLNQNLNMYQRSVSSKLHWYDLICPDQCVVKF